MLNLSQLNHLQDRADEIRYSLESSNAPATKEDVKILAELIGGLIDALVEDQEGE